MNRYRPRQARAGSAGFTLFELAVVVAIIGILAFMLLQRVFFFQEEAERVAAQQLLGTLRSALHLQVANLIVKGREKEIPGLAAQNPMDWLVEMPANYKGEFFSPKAGELGTGIWYFDRTDKKLVYRYNNFSEASNNTHKQLNFKVKLVTMKNDVDGHANQDGVIEGVVLDQFAR